MKKLLVYFCLIFLVTTNLFAQNRYTTENKKAISSYEMALNAFDKVDYDLAIENMLKAIKYDDQFVEAHLVLAEIYISKGNRKEAIQSYQKVIDIDPDFFPGLYLSLAHLEMFEGNFDQAKMHLEKYLNYKNLKPISISLAKKRLESCEFAMKAIKNPVPFNPVNLGENINTKYDEYWPTLTADEQTLIFTRLIPKDLNQIKELPFNNDAEIAEMDDLKRLNSLQEDFFISLKENNFWSLAVNAGEPLNTPGNEGAQTILANGRLMYFTACNRAEGKGRCDIYSSIKSGNNWSVPENIGSPVNTKNWEAQPSISADGTILYFVSNREGGFGQKDIWYSTLKPDNTWSDPVNLGESINTSGDEQSPFIHPDNKTLYFASEGKVGMGGFDLFKVTKNDDGTWGEAENLGYPINTVFDEIGLIVNAKGDRAFFSSDRLSEQGRDIFEFELYKEARPQPVSYLKGRVFDADSKMNLSASFELINLDSKQTIMKSESDQETGEFLVCIPTDNDYALNVSKEGYLFYSDHFSLKGVHDISKPFSKDVELKPIKAGEVIILKNIFYATDSFELIDKSIVELNKLVLFMENNPKLKIEISGHTDNIGNADYNIQLSENRAKSVYNYLINHGIDLVRLSFKGYGETKPVESNDTEEGRAQNRRTEIKIL